MMTYQQTIEYLYGRLPMFSHIGVDAYKKDLHNTLALCKAFHHPQKKFTSIHVAGTNGKGSTSHMLAAIFQTAGYKTGLYTSPHLKDFRERIKINGAFIDDDFVVNFVAQSKPWIDEIEPSFFELTVVMAFEYFAQQKVDIAIIETGLGGRLDSTNVIQPVLSVITNIGYDHQQILGNTLQQIAFEKAGIIKQNTPVVIGETLPETVGVFTQKAKQETAPIYFAEKMLAIKNVQYGMVTLMAEYEEHASHHRFTIESDLTGIYQQKNIRTVLAAVLLLADMGYNLPLETVQKGIAQTKKLTGLHGRWQLVQSNPYVVLDVGHNEDGIKQILANILLFVNTILNAANPPTVHIVIGMVKDKDVEKILKLFSTQYPFYYTNAHLPRAMPAPILKQIGNKLGLMGPAFDDVNAAIAHAKLKAMPQDLIVVCGSVFTVGEVLLKDGMLPM